ncbi:FAD-dependent oxidoreductase [Pseudochryseolinea flava]|uniref:FAD-dependent oxidoreductase n=1 Tax=Pseudochryseolinea flava TaxID=2059302 RepID=A0A364XYX9_9BACT|nr:FAD-dependent oxidoreductase [Pseudochryseolinea flava]RAV98639.1 FAD-dependent oxidoreductase [Pseudochryseolinea flava]
MIARDGAHESLWQQTTFEYHSTSQWKNNQQFDVAIVGGGITGITTALLLQQAGKKCIILEAQNIGFGTTGGTTAHLNTLLDTPYQTIIKNFDRNSAKMIAQAAKDAISLIRQHVEIHDIDCGFQECSAYLFAQDEKQNKELDSTIEATLHAGVVVNEVHEIPVPINFTRAIEIPGQAKFHPLRYVYKLAQIFIENGGVITQYCRVTNAESKDDVVHVETSIGSVTCNTLIYATHIPPGINLIHLRCSPFRSYAMAVQLKDAKYPEHLAYDMYDPYHYYRTQEIDGKSYLIVGGNDHKTGEEKNTESVFLNLESHVRSYFNVERTTQRWSSQYYEPADGIPYIGVLPGNSKNILVATGFGGNGMIYSAVAARVLTDIITLNENALIDLFSPSRIKPIAGFQNFVSHNADVVKELFKKLKPIETLNSFADLAPGEGKVAKIEGETVGAYKDNNGAIHLVSATCTHMGCPVHWNSTEKSWDCSCHGARYSVDGKVLNGPTDRDLNLAVITGAKEKVNTEH